jgi:Leucine-rich repeat (LRR) protein
MSRLAVTPLVLAVVLPAFAADPPKPTAAEEKLLAKLKGLKGEATLDPELDAAARVAVTFEKAEDKTVFAFYKEDGIGAVEIRDIKGLNDQGFAGLKRMKNLQKLVLAGGDLKYLEAKHLSECPRLTTLYVGGVKMSDAAIIGLKGLTKLKTLDLLDAPISDKAIDTIVQFADLENLNLSGTKVTDAGVKKLLAMKNLKRLELNNSKVTRAGYDALVSVLEKEKRELIVRW